MKGSITWCDNPIIVMGMHRSGTTLLTRLLERVGLFVGSRLCPATHEPLFFQRINEWALMQAGGSWDNPEPFRHVLENGHDRSAVTEFMREYLGDPAARQYWGANRVLPLLPRAPVYDRWGWKDPRNTITLPIWLDIFPQARVVYVERHGVDVANSLVTRKVKSEAQDAGKPANRGLIERLRRPRGRRLHSPRCGTLEGAFSLWEAYCEYGRSFLEEIPKDRKYTLKFEQLAEDPESQLRRLSEFCGLSPTSEEIDAATKSVRKSRVYAFSETEQLARFAEQVAPRLRRYGY